MDSTVILSGNYVEVLTYEKPIPVKSTDRRWNSTKSTSNQRGHRDITKRAVFSLRRARRNFIRIARSNLTGTDKPAFLTLTFAANVDLDTAAPLFNVFAKKLSYHFPGIRYLAVPEFQKRGAVHYHCLVWGIPQKTILYERYSREIAGIWNHGFIDVLQTDGSQKLAAYMAKYLLKAMQDSRLVGRRVYNASRNILRPIFNLPQTVLDNIETVFGGPVDKQVLTDRQYPTDWRGWCRYQLIKLIPKTA